MLMRCTSGLLPAQDRREDRALYDAGPSGWKPFIVAGAKRYRGRMLAFNRYLGGGWGGGWLGGGGWWLGAGGGGGCGGKVWGGFVESRYQIQCE
jgi:hypothetical protein